jgi:hypothetical protein
VDVLTFGGRTRTLPICLLAGRAVLAGACNESSDSTNESPEVDVFAFADACVWIATAGGSRFIAPPKSADAFELRE